MSRKYIKQINDLDFVFPNKQLAEYDVEIVHDINDNCVSGTVNSLTVAPFTSTGLTVNYDITWNLNGAEPWIRNSNLLGLFSIHMLAPGQDYYKPWRLILSNATSTITGTTFNSASLITVTPAAMGLTSFAEGTYYFEVRFIGHTCISPVCVTLNLAFATPTPTPTATPVPPTPTPTATIVGPTPTPTPTATSIGPTPTPTATSVEPEACDCYCVTYETANLPEGLEVRYRSCETGEITTDIIANLETVDNLDGTFTACVCVDQNSSYATPVCVSGATEIVCPVGIDWVLGGNCTINSNCLPLAIFEFTNCGRGGSEAEACSDATTNSRIFYSDCDTGSFGANCNVYTDTLGTQLTGFTHIFMNNANWDVSPVTGIVVGPSAIQC